MPVIKIRDIEVSAGRALDNSRCSIAVEFDYSLNYDKIDFRAQPNRYRIGRGEQGVLLVQPYKDELLPHWRFKTPELAFASANKLYEMFLGYKAQGDFVGMDMARKFIQMGYTRARRYANHKSGRKWSHGRKSVLPLQPDPIKAESAFIFQETLRKVRGDEDYQRLGREHRERGDRHARKNETRNRRP